MFSSLALLLALALADETDAIRYRDLPHTETDFSADSFETLAAWNERRTWLRAQVRQAAGLWPELPRTPLGARVFDRFDGDGFTVEKVVFESAPGLLVTGNLYRPTGSAGRRPAVLCPHGHWSKGRINHEERGSIPARCITLARLGAVVFAYDMLGYNDSGKQIQHGSAELTAAENELWSLGPFALQTWNSIRALDFVSGLLDVDPERIGVTGASGGGTQTFILSAVDDRVRVACPVNMISHVMQGGCACENAPGLRLDANNMDIAALFAPKPLLMISASGDWTRDTPRVEYPFVRQIYALYGVEERVANAHFEAPHNYNAASRAAMYRFFARWLLQRPDWERVQERPLEVPPAEDLLVFAAEDPDLPTPAELMADLRRQVHERLEAFRPRDEAALDRLQHLVRSSLAHAVGAPFPGAEQIRLLFSRADNLVTARRQGRSASMLRITPRKEGRVTFVFDPRGLEAYSAVEALESGGSTEIWIAEPFGTGDNVPPADAKRGTTRYFTTFNRTDDAETLFDVQSVLAAELHDASVRELRVVATGDIGPIVLAALATLPEVLTRDRVVRAAIDLGERDWAADRTWLEHLHLPNIRRVGGLPGLLLTAPGELTITGTGDAFAGSWYTTAVEHGLRSGITLEKEKAGLAELFRSVSGDR